MIWAKNKMAAIVAFDLLAAPGEDAKGKVDVYYRVVHRARNQVSGKNRMKGLRYASKEQD